MGPKNSAVLNRGPPSKELSWFERLNLKLEALIEVDPVSTSTDLVQQTSQYVETSVTSVGTNMRKLCGDFMRDVFLPPFALDGSEASNDMEGEAESRASQEPVPCLSDSASTEKILRQAEAQRNPEQHLLSTHRPGSEVKAPSRPAATERSQKKVRSLNVVRLSQQVQQGPGKEGPPLEGSGSSPQGKPGKSSPQALKAGKASHRQGRSPGAHTLSANRTTPAVPAHEAEGSGPAPRSAERIQRRAAVEESRAEPQESLQLQRQQQRQQQRRQEEEDEEERRKKGEVDRPVEARQAEEAKPADVSSQTEGCKPNGLVGLVGSPARETLQKDDDKQAAGLGELQMARGKSEATVEGPAKLMPKKEAEKEKGDEQEVLLQQPVLQTQEDVCTKAATVLVPPKTEPTKAEAERVEMAEDHMQAPGEQKRSNPAEAGRIRVAELKEHSVAANQQPEVHSVGEWESSTSSAEAPLAVVSVAGYEQQRRAMERMAEQRGEEGDEAQVLQLEAVQKENVEEDDDNLPEIGQDMEASSMAAGRSRETTDPLLSGSRSPVTVLASSLEAGTAERGEDGPEAQAWWYVSADYRPKWYFGRPESTTASLDKDSKVGREGETEWDWELL